MGAEVISGLWQQNAQLVVQTDVDYQVINEDAVVIATAALTLTLPPNPLPGSTHLLVASGGQITVEGGLIPVSGLAGLVPADSSMYVVFSNGEWTAASGGGSGVGEIVVANVAALSLLPDTNLPTQTRARVTTLDAVFELDTTSTATLVTNVVVATLSGTGRWLRKCESSPHWLNQSTWFVDPSGGTAFDENTGLSSGSPLGTMQELARRLQKGVARSLITVNLLSNLTNASDFFQVDATMDPQGSLGVEPTAAVLGPFGPVVMLIQGVRTVAASGTCTADIVAPNPASAPAGLPVVLTSAGFDFSSHVGRLLRIATSPVGAAVGTVGVIIRAPALGTAHLAPLANLTTRAALTAASYVGTNTSTFEIYTTTTWAAHASPGLIPTAQITYRDIEFTATSVNVIYDQIVEFQGCVIRRPIRPAIGGAHGTALLHIGCSFLYAAPPGGRSPTQLAITAGDFRVLCCGFNNVDLRDREGDAKVLLASSVFINSQYNSGGPNDSSRTGSISSLINSFGGFGVGFYDWPAPDLLAPSPSTTRGSSGAAITLGHGTSRTIGAQLYGNNTVANTVGVRVREGSNLGVTDNLTDEAAPVNPPSPGTPFIASSLRLIGTLGEMFVDEEPTVGATSPTVPSTWISEANHRGVLDGSVVPAAGLFVACNTWADWRTNFGRQVVGLRTGATIFVIPS